jgi:hypothetical protein
LHADHQFLGFIFQHPGPRRSPTAATISATRNRIEPAAGGPDDCHMPALREPRSRTGQSRHPPIQELFRAEGPASAPAEPKPPVRLAGEARAG